MTALITGASGGIGAELARIFASNRYDVVLVARNEAKLRELSRELSHSGVRTEIIATDLAVPGAARTIVEHLAARAIEVDVLVNNAGFGLYGQFIETSLETELEMIQLNVVALTELTKRLLPGMVARQSGRILNLATTGAFFSTPTMAVYCATKAYVLSFSEAIGDELAGSGVTVTVLCPGPTASGFQAVAHLENSALVAGRTLPTAREVAHAGFDALMAGKTLFIPGLSNTIKTRVPRILPRRLMTRIVRWVQRPV